MRAIILLLLVLFLILPGACTSQNAAASAPVNGDTALPLPVTAGHQSEVISTTGVIPATQTVTSRPPPPISPPPQLSQTTTLTPKPAQTAPTPIITPTANNSSVSAWTEWGPAGFGKDYPATPGIKLSFVKAGTGTSPDGNPTVIYAPVATGLPKDKSYYFWYKALRQNSPAQLSPLEMNVNDKGYVIPAGQSSPISISCYSFSKGEARVFALMTTDKSIIAYGKVTLYPIQAQQSNIRIWVELLSSTGTIFAVYGDGFGPKEELEETSNSEGEVIKYKIITDENGRFTNMLLPAITGKQSGFVIYTVAGKTGTLTVSFDWGPPALLPGP
jgi:hypothetical protein